MSRRRAAPPGAPMHALQDCTIGQVVAGDVIVQHLTINLVGGSRKTVALLAALTAAVHCRQPVLPQHGYPAGA